MIHTTELICQLDHNTFNSLEEALIEPMKTKQGNNTVLYRNFPNYGIKVTLKRYDSDTCNKPSYFVYLILNLAKLVGQNDSSIHLYQICDFNEISDKFREAMSSITSGDLDLQELCDIKSYKTRRIDFCCQFKVEDPQLYIHLLNRGRFPSHGNYCNKGYKDSCYIVGGKVEDNKIIRRGSITINIYDKQAEMKASKNNGKGYTAGDLSEAENVLRVEVQVFRRKIIALDDKLKKEFGDKFEYPDRYLKNYLNISLAKDMLLSYVNEIAGTSDYFKYTELQETVGNKLYEDRKKDKTKKYTLEILDILNGNGKKTRALWKYEASIRKDKKSSDSEKEKKRDELKKFQKWMKDKEINPIAIPNKLNGKVIKTTHLRSVYSLIEDYFANVNKDSTVPTDDRLDEEHLLEEAITADEVKEDFAEFV